ncbi:hypothetical protein, conserved [Leishmania tarentolae]|uniref:Anaphase-promoting complex subunit 4 WD40 domain-containing protein n=1 Tax=Leishmania tarentolae TaxID=5689 RepID=A0A640KIA5_LEITA|nr:hypothetical protein, conserved [Leishmania tarentolae]
MALNPYFPTFFPRPASLCRCSPSPRCELRKSLHTHTHTYAQSGEGRDATQQQSIVLNVRLLKCSFSTVWPAPVHRHQTRPRMKLLHSKSTAEPILAVTACPCANLFALVTQASVAVYRSTTLTTVFNFSLKPFQVVLRADGADGERRNGSCVCCCWSPSGRLFTLALPSGLLLVLDVEGGALVRFLTPGDTAPVSGNDTGGSSSPPTLANVPRVPTTLPPDRPVLAMGWCAVHSLYSRQVNAMHVDVQTRCLPVRTGMSAALLEEVAQASSCALFGAGGAAHELATAAVMSGGYHRGAKHSSRSVSLLMVLGCDGVLRCLIGGLYEMQRLVLSLPSCLAVSPGNGISGHVASWEDVVIEDMQVRQWTVPSGALAGKQTCARRGTGLLDQLRFAESAASGVRPALTQQHSLYLTVAGASSGSAAHSLWEVSLHDNLSALAVPHWIALCYVREYTRLTREVYEKVTCEWHAVLRGRLWSHLGLPAAAPLLYSAVLAQLTEPDPLALYKYAKKQLMRTAVTEDLEVMATTVQRAIHEVTHACYRCCEVAMAYAAHLREPDTVTQHLGTLRRLCESSLRRITKEAEDARDVALWVLQQSCHWTHSPRFAMAAADERALAEAEEDQLEKPFAAGAAAADMGPPTSSQQPPSVVEEVPLSAMRQPALLSYLSSIAMQETSMDGDPVIRLCAKLDIIAKDCASFSAPDTASLSVRIVTSSVQEAVVASAPTTSQLLCCVLEGVEEGERGSHLDDDDDENSATAAPSNDGDGDEAASRYHRLYEAGLDDVAFGERNRDVACDECGCALITELAHLHVLHSAPTATNTIQALQIGTYKLMVHPDGDAGVGTADSPAASALLREASPTINVDVNLITSRLKVEREGKQGCAAPCVYGATWYGYLEEDRHVVVCQPRTVTASHTATPNAWCRSAAPATFFVAIIDDSGHLLMIEEEEHDGDNEAGDDAASSSAAAASSARAALCEVTGMEDVPLRVSMSRSRSFCVVVGVTKYIVLSLYDDDY